MMTGELTDLQLFIVYMYVCIYMCVCVYLTFMELCIARCVFYITYKVQLIQCSLLLSALYMFRAVFPPIIGSL